MTIPLTMTMLFDLKILCMKECGCSEEDILREAVRTYNQAKRANFSIVPFGSRLVKGLLLDEERVVEEYRQKHASN